jgi:hypothetical protein
MAGLLPLRGKPDESGWDHRPQSVIAQPILSSLEKQSDLQIATRSNTIEACAVNPKAGRGGYW